MKTPIRCLVADDHPPVVDAVVRYLTHDGFDVVGTARTGDDALAKIERMRPQVALVDVHMPGGDGLHVVREAARSAPETAVVLYSGDGDRALLAGALDAGARGFVLKEAPLADLVRALETAAGGGLYVDPVAAGAAATRENGPELTARERDVLRYLADGFSNEEIGAKLFISPETVRAHLRKARLKLGARTRTQAVATAMRLSLIT